MFLKLIRNRPSHHAITGRLLIDGNFFCDTIENCQCAIAAGLYPLRLTMSPKFGEVLPLLDNVIGRSGIRIHPGNTASDSSGCILVGEADEQVHLTGPNTPRLLSSRATFNRLRQTLLTTINNHEKIYISVEDAAPDVLTTTHHSVPNHC